MMEEAKQQNAALVEEGVDGVLLLLVAAVEVVARQRAVTRMGSRRRRRGGGRQHARSWGEEEADDDVPRKAGGLRLARAGGRRSEGTIVTPVLGTCLRRGLESCGERQYGASKVSLFSNLPSLPLSNFPMRLTIRNCVPASSLITHR